MVRSNTQPDAIMQVKDKIYLRQNIQRITETDEMTGQEMTFYEYDEVVIVGYSLAFAEEYFDDIMTNPHNYDLWQINGVYQGDNPHGI